MHTQFIQYPKKPTFAVGFFSSQLWALHSNNEFKVAANQKFAAVARFLRFACNDTNLQL
jgi:hypothetical protein